MKRVACFVAMMYCALAHGDTVAVTEDGRRVMLKDDGTWENLPEAPGTAAAVPSDSGGSSREQEIAVLTVELRRPAVNACRFGLRLQNDMSEEIKNVVPQITALLADGTAFDTVFVGFHAIKPTRYQYKEITFSGVVCEHIAGLVVSGGDRCSMAGLDVYSTASGECLSHIDVRPSELVKISK